MTDDKAPPADVTRRDHEALVAYALASDLQNDPLVIDLCAALAAERDRADRAEAKLTTALEIADVWIDSEPSDPAPISVVTAGRVFRGLLTSEATA